MMCSLRIRSKGTKALRRGGSLTSRLALPWLLVLCFPVRAAAESGTALVDLRLRTGGTLRGQVLDYTDHGLVVTADGKPYVFAWAELESGSACQVRCLLMDLHRGGREHYLAEDYLALGGFALAQERTTAAAEFFRLAAKLDRRLEAEIQKTLAASREIAGDRSVSIDHGVDNVEFGAARPSDRRGQEGLSDRLESALNALGEQTVVSASSPELSAAVEEIYRKFGGTVQKAISKNIALVETEHFLIWTDWNPDSRRHLAGWCEAMYAALCHEWGLDPRRNVFLAKCPVFCFRAKPRFRDFAWLFDGHDVSNSLGYTRSIESNGHVHVAVLRQGESRADFERFAVTLVHEGTHAFLHRLYGPRLIPHWVNEGYADWMAERVLGERCFTGENADLLARQYARHDWPIGDLLQSAGPIDLQMYPVAQSVVRFLKHQNPAAFRAFLRSLKEGRSVPEALAENYEQMTLIKLEQQWRTSVGGDEPLVNHVTTQP